MSRGSATMYLAWGGNMDIPGSLSDQLRAEKRTADSIIAAGGSGRERATTAIYEPGPGFRIEETDLVSFGVFVVGGAAGTASLFIKVEHSYDGENWAPQSAGLAIAAVGVAPDQEAQSEILPFVKEWKIPTAPADQKIFFNYEQRAAFTRVSVKNDAGAAEIFIQAGV